MEAGSRHGTTYHTMWDVRWEVPAWGAVAMQGGLAQK